MPIEPKARSLRRRTRTAVVVGRMRTAVAFGVVLLLAGLAIVSILPAWSMTALPLRLASSELSPVLALAAAIWLPVSSRLLAMRAAQERLATRVLVVVTVLALWPLAGALIAARRADAELEALGIGPLLFGATLASLPTEPTVRHSLVHYTASDGSPLTMRLFDLDDGGSESRPIVIVIYGGAWRAGSPQQGGRISDALARRGYLVAAIDYRHAPRFQFPTQLEDVRRSIALVCDSAAAWRGDSLRIALLGRSAGGHLAELAAFVPGASRVRGVVAIYAPWNLAEGYRDVPSPDPIGVRQVIRDFVGGTPEERPQRYRAASPASYVRNGLPPVLLLYASRDHLVKPEFNREAARALRAADVGVAAIELPWSEHGFDVVPGGLGERLTWAVTERFLGAVLGNGS